VNAEILVNVTPMEARVAVVENGAAQDIHIERQASRGIVGNIYAGRVVRVMPGMQAAFVEIGVSRTAFIHLADIIGTAAAAGERIGDHLRDGQVVTVQVVKDPIGNKGARLTDAVVRVHALPRVHARRATTLAYPSASKTMTAGAPVAGGARRCPRQRGHGG
jgi:Ribonuclease G/E